MALKFQKLRVAEVVRETPEAITIYFERPAGEEFNYLPGQYLTLRVSPEGKNLNRAYSLCSSPTLDRDRLAVTVKMTPGGKVSTYLNSHLAAGAEMDVMPPLGNFVARIDETPRHYVLIGAGSGITPLMSILRTALAANDRNEVSLIYGNRREDCIIFHRRLLDLKSTYGDRLRLIHSLSQPPTGWAGRSGRLAGDSLKSILAEVRGACSLPIDYFLCGPAGLMDEAHKCLLAAGTPEAQIHQEHFSAPAPDEAREEPTAMTPGGAAGSAPAQEKRGDYNVTVIIEGEKKDIRVRVTDSVLEAALDNDLDPPYACMIGSCCTCKAKLVAGKVIMDDREGLTDEEIRQGYVLTCQSHPVTEGVILDYDDV